MVKALLKKQMLELNAFYFHNKKSGKRRSPVGTVLFTLLMVFLFALLGFSFFGVAWTLAESFIPKGLAWLLFALMSTFALVLGIFGSVFQTYAALYRAKDNDLLLSLPIPPSRILLVRLMGTFFTGLLYEALVMIPTAIAFWLLTPATVATVLGPLLLILLLGIVVLVLTCLFGWLVALVAGRVKRKSGVTVVLSLLFFAGYYYVFYRLNELINEIAAHAEVFGKTVKNAAYPLYLLGRAGAGEWLYLLISAVAVAVVLGLTWLLLSKTFLWFAKQPEAVAVTKTPARVRPVKASGVDAALLRREWKRFTGSALYMMNCAFGTLMMPAAGVAALLLRDKLTQVQNLVSPDLLYILLTAGACLLSVINDITAPSISLEGRQIGQLQVLPVAANRIFAAKQRLHLLMTMPAAVVLCACLAIAVAMPWDLAVIMTATVLCFVNMMAAVGLCINLKKPSLVWTNETVPIKQSASVGFCLLGGWAMSLVLAAAGAGAVLKLHTSVSQTLVGITLVLALIGQLLNRWLKGKGAEIFDALTA